MTIDEMTNVATTASATCLLQLDFPLLQRLSSAVTAAITDSGDGDCDDDSTTEMTSTS